MAGLGTRLRPHTWSKPKALLQLAGKTVLDHVLDQFKSLPQSFEPEYIFIVGPYQGEQIKAFMEQYYPETKASYPVQEVMRGQSHALWQAREYLSGPMLMVFADTLVDADFSILEGIGEEAVAWVKEVPDPRRFGVTVLNETGKVTRLVEKPTSMDNRSAVVGFYYFPRGEDLVGAIQYQMDENIMLKNEYFLADAINIMLERGMKLKVKQTDIWLDAGIPSAVLETNRYLLEKGYGTRDTFSGEGVTLLQPVSIASGVVIKNSVIGPNVTVGRNCVIENVILRNSIIDAETSIRDLVIEGSLIGRNAVLQGKAEKFNLGDDADFIR
jgi:glucose-1-phosphate thymidylyltransferase